MEARCRPSALSDQQQVSFSMGNRGDSRMPWPGQLAGGLCGSGMETLWHWESAFVTEGGTAWLALDAALA